MYIDIGVTEKDETLIIRMRSNDKILRLLIFKNYLKKTPKIFFRTMKITKESDMEGLNKFLNDLINQGYIEVNPLDYVFE